VAERASTRARGKVERLHKRLADAGLGSRREVERWIADGRVTVNGRRAQLGERAGPDDRIRVDGRPVTPARPAATRVLAYHKLAGEICTRADTEGRPTVFDRLPRLARGRWVGIGRLDAGSLGLLLLTNDGELAHRLMHPSAEVEREYAVRVLGEVTPEALARLRAGVELEDGRARFERIVEAGGSGANRWFHVVLHEGRTREVRRLWASQGVTVSRLMRVRYGPIRLPPWLRAGRWVELDADAVAALAAAAERGARPRTASRRPRVPVRNPARPRRSPLRAPRNRPRGS